VLPAIEASIDIWFLGRGNGMALRVAVSGAAGRMGKRLISSIVSEPDCELVCACERSGHPDLGRDVGELTGCGHIGIPLTDGIGSGPDAIIDFSSPEGAMRAIHTAVESGVPIVVGTTALGAKEKAELEAAAGRVAVVATPNFSVGVNLLFRVVHDVAQALGPGYDIEIIEAHHNQKADAPSGTALRLGETVASALRRDPKSDFVHGRRGQVGARRPTEIGFHAVRGGDIIGEHTVLFAGGGERIELTHRVSTRDAFVKGAMRAARFLVGKAPGKYSMEQVLGLE
jgi:4-hydroxy-tetrahydrodipicolinate reductase